MWAWAWAYGGVSVTQRQLEGVRFPERPNQTFRASSLFSTASAFFFAFYVGYCRHTVGVSAYARAFGGATCLLFHEALFLILMLRLFEVE